MDLGTVLQVGFYPLPPETLVAGATVGAIILFVLPGLRRRPLSAGVRLLLIVGVGVALLWILGTI